MSYNTYNPKTLKDAILRRLGAPVISVEVTEDQIYDCIQRALELYTDYPNDNLRSLDEYSRAIDVATKHESLSQREIGQKVIELVRAQIPFIEEMLDDRRYY